MCMFEPIPTSNCKVTIFIHHTARKRLRVSVDDYVYVTNHAASTDMIEKVIECMFGPSYQEPQPCEIINTYMFNDN